jgi:hypothetical protein
MSVRLLRPVSIIEAIPLTGQEVLTHIFPGLIGEPYVSMIVDQLPYFQSVLEFHATDEREGRP